jgi:uncharacterized membrane protein
MDFTKLKDNMSNAPLETTTLLVAPVVLGKSVAGNAGALIGGVLGVGYLLANVVNPWFKTSSTTTTVATSCL